MGKPNDVSRDTSSLGTEMDGDLPDDESHVSFSEEPQQSSEEIESADQLTQQRLTEEMRSSYWILEELRRLTDEFASESEQSSDSITSDDRAEPNSTDSGNDSAGERLNEILTTVQTLEKARSNDTSNRSTDIEPSLPIDDSVVTFVSDLQRQLGAFGVDLEKLTERQETRFGQFSDEVDRLTDRIDWMEFIQEQFAEAADLHAVAEDLTASNERIAELQSTSDELESEMEREFDSIETLFHRVLDAVEGLDSELETAVSSFREELEPLQAHQLEREKLESLKAEAIRLTIRRGNCEKCGQSIDLSLLESPTCPSCSTLFTGIDTSSWNPFRSPRFKTE